MYPFYLGLDLHKNNTYTVLIDQAGDVVDQRQISNDETTKYLNEVVPRETYAVLEATRNWPFMYDLLSDHVDRVELAYPKDLKKKARRYYQPVAFEATNSSIKIFCPNFPNLQKF